MGSVANWSASLELRRSIDIKKKVPNTIEEIKNFLSKNNISQSGNRNNLDENSIIVECNFGEEEYNNIQIKASDGITIKRFFDEKLYETLDGFEDYNSYYEEENLTFMEDLTFVVLISENDVRLLKLDLQLYKKYVIDDGLFWNGETLVYGDDFMENVGGYIYCNTDNSESSEYVITQDFIDSIKPGDRLILSGDGSGDNC